MSGGSSRGPAGSLLRQAVDLGVRAGLLAVDTTAAFLETTGRISGAPVVQRTTAAQGRFLRSVGAAWASEARRLLR